MPWSNASQPVIHLQYGANGGTKYDCCLHDTRIPCSYTMIILILVLCYSFQRWQCGSNILLLRQTAAKDVSMRIFPT